MPNLNPQERFDIIYTAAKEKDEQVISALLSEGLSLDEKGLNDQYTASFKLAKEGDLDSAKFLVQHGGVKSHVMGGLAASKSDDLMQRWLDEHPKITRSLLTSAIYAFGFDGDMIRIKKYMNKYPEYKIPAMVLSDGGGLAAGNHVNLLKTFLNENNAAYKSLSLSVFLVHGFAISNNTGEVDKYIDKYIKNFLTDIQGILLVAAKGYVKGKQLEKAIACSNHSILAESKLTTEEKTNLSEQVTIAIATELAMLGDTTTLNQFLKNIKELPSALLIGIYCGFLQGHHLHEADEWASEYSTKEKWLVPAIDFSTYLADAGCFAELNYFLLDIAKEIKETGNEQSVRLLRHSLCRATETFARKSNNENLISLFDIANEIDQESLSMMQQIASANHAYAGNLKEITLSDLNQSGQIIAGCSFGSKFYFNEEVALHMLTFTRDAEFRKKFAEEMQKFKIEKAKDATSKPTKVLDLIPLARHANQIEKLMTNYELNFYQSLAWTNPTFLCFVLQLDKLIENGKLTFDAFFTIACYLSPVTTSDLKALMPIRETKESILNRNTLFKITSAYKTQVDAISISNTLKS